MLRLKFQGASAAAEPMGELVARCAAEWFSGEFDTVTWVPVSKKRLRKRGYDQAELLARAACRRWDTQPVRLLEKVVDNPAQSGIHDAAARRANVLGGYSREAYPSGGRYLYHRSHPDGVHPGTEGRRGGECGLHCRGAGPGERDFGKSSQTG